MINKQLSLKINFKQLFKTRPKGLMLTCERLHLYLTLSENLNHFVSHS